MRIPKRYGEARSDNCPFCDRQSITQNEQGIPVCKQHQNSILNEMKCLCGEFLETCTGKFGLYFRCIKCGNINKKKVFEINPNREYKEISSETKREYSTELRKETFSELKRENLQTTNSSFQKKTEPKERKEIIIRSDDPFYFS